MKTKKEMKPGDLFNAHKAMAMKKKKLTPQSFKNMGAARPLGTARNVFNSDNDNTSPMVANSTPQAMLRKQKTKRKGLKLNPPSKGRKPTGAHGRAAVKALGRTKTTGNFAKIAKARGKGAAIMAYQNALRAHKGKKITKKRKMVNGMSNAIANPNSPVSYDKAMTNAYKNTKVFGTTMKNPPVVKNPSWVKQKGKKGKKK